MVTNAQNLQDHGTGISAVKQYIRDHLGEPLNRDVLAAVAGFSVSHFHRVFTANTGENIAGYVRRVRLERAGRKLRMGAVDIVEFTMEPTNMGPTTAAVLNDTCGNLIQIYQVTAV